MQLINRQDGGHTVAGLRGELDAVNAADRAAAITAVMTPGLCLIADMTSLESVWWLRSLLSLGFRVK